MPAFYRRYLSIVSLALILAACGSDGSGENSDPDNLDTDSDGVVDSLDAFPNDPTETTDTDGDGVGDSLDAFPNDPTETKDTDGDGVGDNADAFPNDPTETKDTDDDNIGDNADVDLDGDGLIELYTLEQLDWVRNDLAGTSLTDQLDNSDSTGCPTDDCNGYELMADLDFDTNSDGVLDTDDTYYDYDDDGNNNGWLPIGSEAFPFAASFDGNNFSISNLYISRLLTDDDETLGEHIGLFGYVSTEANQTITLGNLKLDGALMFVKGLRYTGGLAGYVTNYGTQNFNNTTFAGRISNNSHYTGGLIGEIDNYGTQVLSNNTVSGDVSGKDASGGLVGHNENDSTGTQVVSNNIVTGELSGALDSGGLIGRLANEGSLTLSQNIIIGDVSGVYVGGLVGDNDNDGTQIIRNNYVTGDVSGGFSGGLVGYSSNSGPQTVSNNLVSSALNSTTNSGAFIGKGSSYPVITYMANYYNIDEDNVSGLAIIGHGTEPEEGEVEGFTLTELQCPETSDDASCAASILYDGWSSLIWDFGTASELPGLVIDDVIYRDANGDGTLTMTDI